MYPITRKYPKKGTIGDSLTNTVTFFRRFWSIPEHIHWQTEWHQVTTPKVIEGVGFRGDPRGSRSLRPSGFQGNSRSFRSALATLSGGWNDPCLFFLSPPLSVFFLYWVYPSIEPIYRLWRPFQDLCRAFKDICGVSFIKRGLWGVLGIFEEKIPPKRPKRGQKSPNRA